TSAGADRYVTYFREMLLPSLRILDGHLGAVVAVRSAGDAVEVTVLTFWESMASIRGFSSEDPTAAVVEPEARALLERIDLTVEHFDVLVSSWRDGSSDAK